MSALAEEFRRDGAVCVRGAFSPDEVALVERGIERNLAEPSPRALVASRPDDPGRFVEDFCNWQSIPEYERFIHSSPAAAIAGELMVDLMLEDSNSSPVRSLGGAPTADE